MTPPPVPLTDDESDAFAKFVGTDTWDSAWDVPVSVIRRILSFTATIDAERRRADLAEKRYDDCLKAHHEKNALMEKDGDEFEKLEDQFATATAECARLREALETSQWHLARFGRLQGEVSRTSGLEEVTLQTGKDSWIAEAKTVAAATPAPKLDIRTPEWQPIESAPKDGSRILVTNGEEVHCVEWSCDDDRHRMIKCPRSKSCHAWCVPGSYQDEQGGHCTIQATGWMNTPEAITRPAPAEGT